MVAGMPYPMAKASVIRVNHIVRSLVSRYPDVKIKLFAYRGAAEPATHPQVELHLTGGFDAKKENYYSWGNKLAADFRIIRELIRHRGQFDLIHCHTIEGLFMAQAFRLLALRRVPVCIDVHGPIVAEMVHYGLIPDWKPAVAAVSTCEKWMLSSVARAFVSNEGLRETMGQRMDASRIRLVYDYVSLDQFSAERIDPEKSRAIGSRFRRGNEKLITYMGMFKDYQGGEFLLRAFADVARRRTDARLLLVGDGPCRTQYESLIAQLGIADRVELPGLIAHADVPNWLAASDVLVSARVDNHITRSGFVSQMPEYMASGKVIVSTWVSGCRHLLRDGAGILVEPDDVASLAAGLDRALSLPAGEAATLVSKARRNVEKFTWEQGIADVYDTYRELLPASQ